MYIEKKYPHSSFLGLLKIISFLAIKLACCILSNYLKISLKQINGFGAYHLNYI